MAGALYSPFEFVFSLSSESGCAYIFTTWFSPYVVLICLLFEERLINNRKNENVNKMYVRILLIGKCEAGV